jgi:hypothetical protein
MYFMTPDGRQIQLYPQDFTMGCPNLLNFQQRSLALSKQSLGPHRRVGQYLSLAWPIVMLGKGTFKNAYQMPLWDCVTGRLDWWCVKYPNTAVNEYINDEVFLQDECHIGQLGALIFYEMKQRLLAAGLPVQPFEFTRPVIAWIYVSFGGHKNRDVAVSSALTPVIIEHLLEGEFQHHLGQFGHLPAEEDVNLLCAALSHFSFIYSQGRLLVTDVQGTDTRLTDICIHSVKGNCGSGDFGLEGMRCCAHVHRCNKYCQALGLDQYSMTAYLSPGLPPFDVDAFAQQFTTSVRRGILYKKSSSPHSPAATPPPPVVHNKIVALGDNSYLIQHQREQARRAKRRWRKEMKRRHRKLKKLTR